MVYQRSWRMAFQAAFPATIPVLTGYLCLGMAGKNSSGNPGKSGNKQYGRKRNCRYFGKSIVPVELDHEKFICAKRCVKQNKTLPVVVPAAFLFPLFSFLLPGFFASLLSSFRFSSFSLYVRQAVGGAVSLKKFLAKWINNTNRVQRAASGRIFYRHRYRP